MKSNANPSPRRNFLLGATLGTAAAVTAAVTGKSPREAVQTAAAIDDKTDGYRETPHILQYYDTARL